MKDLKLLIHLHLPLIPHLPELTSLRGSLMYLLEISVRVTR